MDASLDSNQNPNPSANEGLRILVQANHVTLSESKLRILAVGNKSPKEVKLTVDGKSVDLQGYILAESWDEILKTDYSSDDDYIRAMPGQWALFANTEVSPGEHMIELDGKRMRIFVKASEKDLGGLADWPVFRNHPLAKVQGETVGCDSCHEIKKDSSQHMLGMVDTLEMCFKCHSKSDFGLIHMHRIEPLESCQLCHEPHGSTKAKWLKDEPKALCTKCHE